MLPSFSVNSEGNVRRFGLRSPVWRRMYVLSRGGNVETTVKSVHSRHGKVIKFADISLETMFRAAQLRKVCYRQTIVISASRSFPPQFLKRTAGGGKIRGQEKRRRRRGEGGGGTRESATGRRRICYTPECKFTYLSLPLSLSCSPMSDGNRAVPIEFGEVCTLRNS